MKKNKSFSLFNIFCMLTLRPIFAPRLTSLFLNSSPFQQRNALSKRTAVYSPSERAGLLRSRICFVSCCVPRSRSLCLLYTEVHIFHISYNFFFKNVPFLQTNELKLTHWLQACKQLMTPNCPLCPNNKNYLWNKTIWLMKEKENEWRKIDLDYHQQLHTASEWACIYLYI